MLASANPAAVARTVEGACALVEDTWPDGAFDAAAADLVLEHLGFTVSDLVAKTNSFGIEGTSDATVELLDSVTYTNSSVIDDVSQVAYSHSTRSGISDEVYGLDRLSRLESGAPSLYVYDGRGSVVQETTGSGSVASWRIYSAFGAQEAGSATGELPSYGYNGEETHPQTGLQYLRFRYYDVDSGRFGVKDSYLGDLSDPFSLNRYLYCFSDPLNWLDPDGHLSRPTNYRVYDYSRSNRTGRLGSSVVTLKKPKGSAKTAPSSSMSSEAQVTYSSMNYAASRYGSPGSSSSASVRYQQAAYYRSVVTKYYCGNAAAMRDDIYGRAQFPFLVHFALTGTDLFPLTALWSNGVHGVLYLGERDLFNAGLSFVSMFINVKMVYVGLNTAEELANKIISASSLSTGSRNEESE